MLTPNIKRGHVAANTELEVALEVLRVVMQESRPFT